MWRFSPVKDSVNNVANSAKNDVTSSQASYEIGEPCSELREQSREFTITQRIRHIITLFEDSKGDK